MVGEAAHPLPVHSASLATAPKGASPVLCDAVTERRDRLAVVGHGVIGAVPTHHARSHCPCSAIGRCRRRISSVLTSRSFARNRFLLVIRCSLNHPALDFALMCVNPRNSNVSGLGARAPLDSRAANRPNSISRVFPGCSPRPNSANRSRSAAQNRSASLTMLEAHDEVVRVAHDDHLATRLTLLHRWTQRSKT